MKIIFSRHAKRQKKWRKITEKEVKSAIGNPDMLVNTIKGRHLKITYKPEDGTLTVITAMVKGE